MFSKIKTNGAKLVRSLASVALSYSRAFFARYLCSLIGCFVLISVLSSLPSFLCLPLLVFRGLYCRFSALLIPSYLPFLALF